MKYSNNNATTLLQQLLQSIRKPILFFMPSTLFEQIASKDLSNLKAVRVVDNIVIINIDGSVKYIESGIQQISLLEKKTILQNTIVSLLQQKSVLNHDAYNYLLEKYTIELYAWVDYSKIMIDYLKDGTNSRNIANYYPELLPFFEMQHNLLQGHKTEFLNKFSEVLKMTNFEYNKYYNNNKNFVVANNLDLENISFNQSDVLDDEQEIDDFLLEYVFNVKLLKS